MGHLGVLSVKKKKKAVFIAMLEDTTGNLIAPSVFHSPLTPRSYCRCSTTRQCLMLLPPRGYLPSCSLRRASRRTPCVLWAQTIGSTCRAAERALGEWRGDSKMPSPRAPGLHFQKGCGKWGPCFPILLGSHLTG